MSSAMSWRPEEVLADGGGAAAVAATIGREQAEPLVNERALRLPFLGPVASDPWTSTTGVPSPHVSTESESMAHTSCTCCDGDAAAAKTACCLAAACSVAVAVSTAPASRSTDA